MKTLSVTFYKHCQKNSESFFENIYRKFLKMFLLSLQNPEVLQDLSITMKTLSVTFYKHCQKNSESVFDNIYRKFLKMFL